MVDATVTHEEGTALDHLKEDTTHRPNIDHGAVMSGSENELRSTIASRTYVGQIRLISEYFS